MATTLTRALKELQTGPARITKAAESLVPATIVYGKDGPLVAFKTRDEYIKAQEALVNKIIDLADRQARVAEGVAKANANTEIELSDYPRKLTIAGAVKLRQVLKEHLVGIVTSIRQSLQNGEAKLNMEEKHYQQRLDAILTNLAGKDSRTSGEDFRAMQDEYRAKQGPELLRGVSDALMERLNGLVKLIDEIDLVLSEKNGQVEIDLGEE